MIKTIQIVGNARYGGATNLMLKWCEYLLERGHTVDVLSTDKTMVSELRKLPDIQVFDSIFIPREIRPIADLRAFLQIYFLLLRNRYDVVHTYTETPGFLGRIAARLAGVPVIVNHQGGWPINEYSSLFERFLYTPLEYLAILASTKNICVSHAEVHMAHKLHIAPHRKLATIVNGINPDPFITASRNGAGKNIRTRLGIDDKHCLIGSTGRLVPVKDIGTLIRSLKLLKFLVPEIPVTLLLAGAGTDQDKLENLVSSLGLTKEVRFLGFVKDISEFLAGIDIFVTTSLSEGLSISLLEAMAAARPIVASSILPNTELIEHAVTGLIVPVKSPDKTARAIARFIQKPDLAQKCAKQARERILKDYTIDRMFQETWNLYNDLLNEGKAVKLVSKQNA